MEAAEPRDTRHVFVCYSRADMETVDAIVTGLAARGHSIWMDRTGIVGSETWRTKIVEALQGSLAVIFFGSKSSYASRHVATELALAEEAQKPIVPVLIDDSRPAGDMLFFLARLHHLKCADGEHRQAIAEIHTALRNIGQPGSIPPAATPPRRVPRSGAGSWIGSTAGLAALALAVWHFGFRHSPEDHREDSQDGRTHNPPPSTPPGPGVTPPPGKEKEDKPAPDAPFDEKPKKALSDPKPQPAPPGDEPKVAQPDPAPELIWLTKGREVVVTLPIPPGLLSDRNGRPLVLTVSFDKGERLKISDAAGGMIELSDQANGRGWLKKSEAATYLSTTP